MSDQQKSGIKINHASKPGEIPLVQLPPKHIQMYQVQRTELITIASGADSLAQQISIAAFGAALGSAPNALACMSAFHKNPSRLDLPSLCALLIFAIGIAVGAVCAFVHWQHKTYPRKLLDEILARGATGNGQIP